MRRRWTVGTLLLGLAVAALAVFNLFIAPGGAPPISGPQGTTTAAPGFGCRRRWLHGVLSRQLEPKAIRRP